jgi:hypothetical protein
MQPVCHQNIGEIRTEIGLILTWCANFARLSANFASLKMEGKSKRMPVFIVHSMIWCDLKICKFGEDIYLR